ncbi:GNAT family N-acetyltransferase [Cellulomonas sp. S1-8]|uniref:GNAT family N-acetyltransferase n=1 Tax=Cellulomonas sp. S1-8 TaxID=2904790 RepID=UPI0022448C93|nr:GNAT family N-acetyltransferase [Cellulomonas sp. S1-8]UZN03755.1 GNAT family N-acetyltransferase [Cellulomonas sp. S1-8]
MTPGLALRPLTAADEREAWRAHDELAPEGFDFLLDGRRDDWDGYLAHLAAEQAGVDLPPGRVPATFLVADVGGVLVGRVSVRHELNEALARVGGHIGYAVRPAYRRRGYATEMLRRSLAVARSVGVERALVTCDDDNVASARTIERCGGVLQDLVPVDDGPPKRRYRVGTSDS